MRPLKDTIIFLSVGLSLLGVAAGVSPGQLPESARKGDPKMDFQIKSTAFENKEPLSARYTGDGPDISPPLQWTNAPARTKALALVCDDPDAPVGTWVHWVLYDIPPDTTHLLEAMPTDQKVLGTAKQGKNDFRKIGYGGPAPPRGSPHRYFFKLYALDAETGLPPGATKADLLKAIKDHVLAEAELMGTYKRR